MTTPSSVQSARTNFDIGPLSWVMGEVREALSRSKAAVQDAVAQDSESQATSVRQAKAYLHQAHGALQIVDIDGVPLITEAVEEILSRVESGALSLNAEICATVSDSFQAVVEYLEELLAGALHQPVRLFPYYRSLMELKGAEKIHPSDLFFPNLSVKLQLPSTPMPVAPNYAALRQRFERALLSVLKSADETADGASLAVMQKALVEIENAQTNEHARTFWWVMHGLAEAVSTGKIKNELYVKQLFARINLQIRRLSEGSAGIAERILRDALFFIAGAVDQGLPQRVQQIRAAFRLQGMVPPDYRQKHYAQINADALAHAKEELVNAKNRWNRIASGDVGAAPQFEQDMAKLAEAGSHLNSPSLSKLLRELSGIARHAAHSNPGESLGLEIAASLLFVENALNYPSRLSEDFSEKADAMTARLLSIVVGEAPAANADWLDDMSRQAQQRQTMSVLATEMQASLAQVEKMLDEYFSNPAKRAMLGTIDSVLHQIEGAMSILDQEDATAAIRHVRSEIRRFEEIEEGAAPDQQALQRVAQNIGALSFFIETLQLTEAGKKRFVFDEKLGVFQANLLNQGGGDNGPFVLEQESLPAPALSKSNSAISQSISAVPTVEEELAQHQKRSAELARSLVAEPGNEALHDQLKASLLRVRSDAALVEDSAADQRAQAAIEILENPDFAPTEEMLAEIVSATAQEIPTPAIQQSVPVSVTVPESDDAIDAELLEIFLGEAQEVLECIRQILPQLRNEPKNQDHMTTLRRSFHTLKGSGRMVGLNAFGEAAWSIEQVLNLRLSDGQGGSPNLYALIDKATEILGAWVDDLVSSGNSRRSPDALVAAAARVKQGEDFSYDDAADKGAKASAQEFIGASAEQSSAPLEMSQPEVVESISIENVPLLEEDLLAFETVVEPAEPDSSGFSEIELSLPSTDANESSEFMLAEVIEFPDTRMMEQPRDENVKRIGNVEISLPLHNIYLAETDDLVRLLTKDFAEWQQDPERDVNILAVHAAHSLSGSSATVGLDSIYQVAHALEMVLQTLARKPVKLQFHEFDILVKCVECLTSMLQKFALDEMPAQEPQQVQELQGLLQDLIARAGKETKEIPREQTDYQHALEAPEEILAVPILDADQDTVSLADVLPTQEVGTEQEQPYQPEVAAQQGAESPASIPLQIVPQEAPALLDEHAVVIKDELDADLLPVFIEEGQDILPQMAQLLRTWQQSPSDVDAAQMLLRQLHTIKGSARMAGAMELGQHMHVMETRIEQITRVGTPTAEAIDELLSRLDVGLYMFDQLRDPDPNRPKPIINFGMAGLENVGKAAAAPKAETLAPAVQTPSQSLPTAVPFHAPASTATHAVGPAAPVPQVRVRADVLDRLVNQAGEVSISRSKVETEVDTLRQSLSELTENVSRLRTQLREIEIQAETQIASQMAHAADREFDPLEFDRFTRLQELTRSMAESVNDVATVQQNLTRTIDGAATDLAAQARLTRELQQDLMRVRMVQFASISERLYRVTRQASKELDKRVHLDIRGGTVEIDRGVLEKMAAPFEHLLRNAIVHGIESREARVAAGKSEIGELLIEIRQEGNEVVMQFSDDGQGLNLNRIREKAQSVGLLTDDSNVSVDELQDMIFHPGFSTAQEVTELAGRGVGMDVVRAEAASLGGRISIESEQGKGARFTIRLPLTLAVTQVVLVSTGGRIYALPSVLVEQVQQLRSNPLAAAYNEGAVMWQGNRVPLFYLSALLGDTKASAIAQQYSPVVILKSGNERAAIHVDEIAGNREVVVKNIGPQLARMLGIAGATVLGSGEIVLILNPVQLAHRELQEEMRAPRLLPSDAPDDMGAVAEMASYVPATPTSQPVQGLRTQHIVMVVDDSLTVRRVTQRFLAREGYQVVLAKDGVDALEQLQSITPDVMLVDIEMPRMDGFDLTRNVRNDERTRHIPIIMITSRTAGKHRNYAMELGVNEYLGKPYQENELLKHISDFVSKTESIA